MGVEKTKQDRKKRTLTGVARLSLPAILAFAEEVSHQVSTCASIVTGACAAVVDVCMMTSGRGRLCAAHQTHFSLVLTFVVTNGPTH